MQNKTSKKYLKNFAKAIDIPLCVCYTSDVPRENGGWLLPKVGGDKMPFTFTVTFHVLKHTVTFSIKVKTATPAK